MAKHGWRSARIRRLAGGAAALAVLATTAGSAAAAPVNLGTASPFVVLGGSAVTNTGSSVLNGWLGVSPGTSITGFPPGLVNGATHANDAVASQAQSDLTTAYNTAAASLPSTDLTGQDLGGLTLTPGAYHFNSSAQLTGALTLNALGNPNAEFVFQIGSTLTTASNSSVVMINGGTPCNVYWQVGSSATIGTTTDFQGNVMAQASITMSTSATAIGRMLARNGAVTLDSNTLTTSTCTTGTSTMTTPGRTSTSRSFTAVVKGTHISHVRFRLDGKLIKVDTTSPFSAAIRVRPGVHYLTSRTFYTDQSASRLARLRFVVNATTLSATG